ncbi:MAG: M23 family metallopeptidase, partial [Spirochaetales bacterium]|nr:M23 family metallopeptidase [Spirochaetales bacterium]
TIYDLAKEYNILPQTLVSYNDISDTRTLTVGRKIYIPRVDGMPYTVKNGDSISKIAESNNISINDLLDVNNLSTDIISVGQQLFIPGAIDNYQYKRATGTLILWPTSGRLSSRFGYRIDPFTNTRRFHYGIDIANHAGTRINSAIDGRVVEIATTSVFGNYIVVEDRYGLQTYYAHLSKTSVKKGQYVTQGQKIGEMGTTGLSTGNHLHFAVYKNGKAVDPLLYLQ